MAKANRRLRSFTAPDFPTLLARTLHAVRGRAGNSQGVWGSGRARAAGRSLGRHCPARRAVRPAYLE